MHLFNNILSVAVAGGGETHVTIYKTALGLYVDQVRVTTRNKCKFTSSEWKR